MKLNDESKELIVGFAIAFLIVLTFAFFKFGATGMRVVAGVAFVTLPFYLIMRKFDFTESERFVFSILLGITVFPSLVYAFGLVISFRVAIAVVFVLSMALAAAVWHYKRQRN